MSSTRVNPYPLPDLLDALSRVEQQQNSASLQLASGSKINVPSDDPAGAASLVQIQDRSTQVDSFQRSITGIQGQLQTADSALSSVVTAVNRAITLGVEGGNGTLSPTDRASIVNELAGIKTQLVSLANTSYQGEYIFAGTAQTQPYVLDAASPSGVTYAGNNGTNQVTIGSGYPLQINQPGSHIFNAAGADIFQAITNLATAVAANSGVDAAVVATRSAFDSITSQRVFYGNALNQSDSQSTVLGNEKVNLGSEQDSIAGADLVAVATQLTSAATARSATLAAISKTSQSSLFDFLK